MTVLQAPSGHSFAAAMRDGSRAEHTAAETSGYMSQLLEGHVNEAGYAALLLRLRPVYDALESTARKLAGDPIIDAVATPALNRLEAIDADLDHWVGSGPRAVDSPAAEAYRERILSTTEWAPLFVAHHYTRYLGDLSGGIHIGRVIRRQFGFDTDGSGFYVFADIADPAEFKNVYRSQLDAAPWSEDEHERVIDEVLLAYRFNTEVFEQLNTDHAAA